MTPAPGAWLFVYGSLRSGTGHPMHEVLAGAARRHGGAHVDGVLYDLGDYPGAVLQPGARVRGELWQVHDDAVWAALDAYEGVDTGEPDAFARVRAVATDDHGVAVTAWIYVWPGNTAGVRRIPSGDALDGRDGLARG